MRRGPIRYCMLGFWLASMAATSAHAVTTNVPGAADVGRIDRRQELLAPAPDLTPGRETPRVIPSDAAPPQSSQVRMVLQDISIEGMTAFHPEEVEDIYKPYLNKQITMDVLWLIAGQLTERYRQAGYFLSKVTVPEQEIADGRVKLRAVEGYIGEIAIDEELRRKSVIREWLERLETYRPLRAEQIESVMLRLNDLPGIALHAVLEPVPDAENPGVVRLTLARKEATRMSGQLGIDNHGSRFLGPMQMLGQVQAVTLPQQRTTFTALTTLPTDELNYGSLKHEIPVIAGGTLELYGNYADAAPGYTLTSSEIRSKSRLLGAAFDYRAIRQRQENLNLRVAFEARDTDSDILGTPLTRDSIRILRGGLMYEMLDGWNGINQMNVMFSQGLGVFGASKAGQLNLSRAEATPDFRKLELGLNRNQALGRDWSLLATASAQLASGPLFSSEEFGYGGQALGRAYDYSEITGDHGIAATAEIRYTGLEAWNGVQAIPYAFYDIGLLWNDDADQDARASASSAGAGIRLQSEAGISAMVGIAFPLTREIANPLDGNGANPRYLMQLSYGF